MTIFPLFTYQKEINMKTILDNLPNAIVGKLDKQPIKLNIRGLRSNEPDHRPNDLRVYPPMDSNGENIGVMILDHERFLREYKVNPHVVNFGKKDRDSFHIGKYDYATDIQRYVKERKEIYSLSLPKKNGEASPLFVPYIDGVFLVITSNQVNQFYDDDNPPLVLDEDEPEGSLFGDVSDEWLDDSYIPPTHSRISFENVDVDGEPISDDNRLMSLFKSDDNSQQTTALVVFDQMNDPNYRATQEFLEKYPNAGQNMDKEMFLSQQKMFTNTGQEVTTVQEQHGYTIMDVEEHEIVDETYISWQEPNGDYVAYPIEKGYPMSEELVEQRQTQLDQFFNENQVSMPDITINLPKSTTVDREVLVSTDDRLRPEEVTIDGKLRNVSQELTFDDLLECQKDLFALPDDWGFYCKPTPVYCDEHGVWDCEMDNSQVGWGLCRHPYPEPTLKDIHSIGLYDTYRHWRREARWSCECGGNMDWHSDKEIEENGILLTPKEQEIFEHSIFEELPDYLENSRSNVVYLDKAGRQYYSRSIFELPDIKQAEEKGVIVDESLLRPLFEPRMSLDEAMRELLKDNGNYFLKSDKLKLSSMAKTSPIKRRSSLLEEVLKEEAKEKQHELVSVMEKTNNISRGNKRNDLIVHTVPTKEQAEYTELFINEVKRRKIDFVELPSNHWLTAEDDGVIHSIPEKVRRKMRYIGRMTEYDSNFDMYALTDTNFKKGKKLVQSLVMADYDKLWYTLRKMKVHGHNTGIDLTNDRNGDYYHVAGYRYPAKLIEPYVWDQQNKHGLVICRRVQTKGGSALFIPYGKATLMVSGERLA